MFQLLPIFFFISCTPCVKRLTLCAPEMKNYRLFVFVFVIAINGLWDEKENTRFISFSHWTARAKGREESEKRKENDKKFTKWVESMLVGCRTMLNPHNHASILRLSENKIPPTLKDCAKETKRVSCFHEIHFSARFVRWLHLHYRSARSEVKSVIWVPSSEKDVIFRFKACRDFLVGKFSSSPFIYSNRCFLVTIDVSLLDVR